MRPWPCGRANRSPLLQRWASQWLPTAAAALAVALAASVLCLLSASISRSVDASTAARLRQDPDAMVRVLGNFRADRWAEADRAVRQALARTFDKVPATTEAALRRDDSVLLKDRTGVLSAGGGVLRLAGAGNLPQWAELVAGSWPHGTDAVVPEQLAVRLHLRPGARLWFGSGSTGTRVSGIYRTTGVGAAVAQTLAGDATGQLGQAAELVLLTRDGFRQVAGQGPTTALWLALPDPDRIDDGGLGQLAARVAAFTSTAPGVSLFASRDPSALPGAAVASALPGAVSALSTPIGPARAALLLPAALLAGLALCCVALTGHQLADHRGRELRLLSARGASRRRLTRTLAADWALTGLPGTLAPVLLLRPPDPMPAAVAVLATLGFSLPLTALSASRLARVRGLDLVVVAVALGGWLRLEQYGNTVGSGGATDPTLLLEPLLAAAGCAVLLVRLLPWLGRGALVLSRGARGMTAPFTGWRLARDRRVGGGLAALMCAAVACGVWATTAVAALDRLDHDRARAQVGADLRVTGWSQEAADARTRDRLLALPGVRSAVPVTETTGTRPDGTAVRVDATPGPAQVPAHGVELPAGTGTLRLDLTLTSDGARTPPQVSLEVEDAQGLDQVLPVPLPPADGVRRVVSVPLPVDGPAQVVGLDVRYPAGRTSAAQGLTLHRFGTGTGWLTTLPSGLDWLDAGDLSLQVGTVVSRPGPDSVFHADYELPGPGYPLAQTEEFRYVAGTPRMSPTVPVTAVTGHGRVGDTVALRLDQGQGLRLHVTATSDAAPGRDGADFLVDQRVLAAALQSVGARTTAPAHWLLTSRDSTGTAAALARTPELGTVLTAAQREAQLRAEPYRAGTRDLLGSCRMLAPVFALMAFALSTARALRARRREFALLRAVGTPRRTLSALLWAQELTVPVLATVPGALLGLALAHVFLPLVTLDPTASALPSPSLRVPTPWLSLTLESGLTVAGVGVCGLALAHLLSRTDLTRALRAGER